MRKIYSLILLLFVTWQVSAQVSVQGQPHPVAKQLVPMKAIAEGTFTMEMIENWTGEGENKAALAIQWNAEGETNALVWGYRWDGEATGEKMIRDIAAADPRFFCMTETGTAYGSTIAGLGYDVNKSGDFAVQKDGKIYYPDEEGVIFTGGYGYDGFTCLDPEDYWQSGWYQGYWSYWLKSSDESAWGYSGVGATGRKLTDGCWDGWNFAVNMSSQPWKEMAPAAKNGPTAPSIKIQPESIVVSPGESATFAPEFKGDTLVYQWYKNEIAIPDAKTPHYTIPSVTVEDAGSYYCIVKNILDEISTDTVTLTVGNKNITAIPGSEPNTAIVTYDDSYITYSGLLTIPSTIKLNGSDYSIIGIDNMAFKGCNKLTSIILPDNLTTLGEKAFSGCTALSSIILPNEVEQIGDETFSGCSALTSITVNDKLKSIGRAAFENCSSLEEVTLGSGITKLESSLFRNNSQLKKVVANGIITSLATYTFNGCSALECIYIKSESVPTASSNTFTNVPETCIIFVPETSVNAYKEANYWKNFIISPWLSSLEIVSTTPSMDFGNGEEANIDKDTKTFTITFNRNIVEKDNISATLKFEDELVNDQVLTVSYADNVLTLNREGERLPAGKYTLVLTTSESVLNITFNVEPWLPELEIVSTTPSMDFGNGEEANIDKDTKTFTITFNRNIVEEDNISATLKLENEVVNDQVLTASYTDNVLTLNREGERLPAGKYTLVLTTSESVLNITFNVINGGVGIENQSSEKIVHTKEYYTINGTALPQPIPGFNIIKITYEDGTVEVFKIYIRSSVNQ